MSDLDQFTISRILGSTVRPFTRSPFGGFAAQKAVGEMFATRPLPDAKLAADKSRDSKILQAFKRTHQGYSIDRMFADPVLTRQFIGLAQGLGVDAPQAAICRRLLRIRKSGKLGVPTTREDPRDTYSFLIPAELAFAQLTYQYDASYDDLLADPVVGEAFDNLARKIGRGRGDVIDYRLAALNLRKNIRARSKDERKKLAEMDVPELAWQSLGTLSKVRTTSIPTTEGILSLSEPKRHLFLTSYRNLRDGIEVFQDEKVLSAIGNRFWSPSPENISLEVMRQEDARGRSLRLLELKSLEVYKPVFNLLPIAA